MCCLLGPFARAMAIESGDAEYTFGGEPSPWQFQKRVLSLRKGPRAAVWQYRVYRSKGKGPQAGQKPEEGNTLVQQRRSSVQALVPRKPFLINPKGLVGR